MQWVPDGPKNPCRLRLCGEEGVTDAGLRAVGRLRTLRRLEFSAPIRRSMGHEALSVAGLAALGALTALSELSLSGNACFTSVGAPFWWRHFRA